jgi:hypothetical protein
MRFTLVYNGPLAASGNRSKPDQVKLIRDKLHPQMVYLWETHAALKRLRKTARVRKRGAPTYVTGRDTPFESDTGSIIPFDPHREADLCEPVQIHNQAYQPLVRKSLDLVCELEILFLRQEDAGALILQGGELDNRIKTLCDALRIPDQDLDEKYYPDANPSYCLLESDSLISRLDVSSDRLLFPQTTYPNEVHLVIEVKVRVLRVGDWNMCLLGN